MARGPGRPTAENGDEEKNGTPFVFGLAAWGLILAGATVTMAQALFLVCDINPGTGYNPGSYPACRAVCGKAVIFLAYDSILGAELWSSAGSTRLVWDLIPGPELWAITALRNAVANWRAYGE